MAEWAAAKYTAAATATRAHKRSVLRAPHGCNLAPLAVRERGMLAHRCERALRQAVLPRLAAPAKFSDDTLPREVQHGHEHCVNAAWSIWGLRWLPCVARLTCWRPRSGAEGVSLCGEHVPRTTVAASSLRLRLPARKQSRWVRHGVTS